MLHCAIISYRKTAPPGLFFFLKKINVLLTKRFSCPCISSHDTHLRYNGNMRRKKSRVVIIGGGFGGVRAALDLLRRDHEDIMLTLIDVNEYHSFTSDYYEVATAYFTETEVLSEERFRSVKGTVAIPFKIIFSQYSHAFRFFKGQVVSIRLREKKIAFVSGKAIRYDRLIVAAGSQSNFFSIPNLETFAFPFKSINDALHTRNAIDELFIRVPKHHTIRIIIAGGGLTGVELAGEVVCFCKKLARIHGHPELNIDIKLLEGSDALLAGLHPWMQKRAQQRLEQLGVQVKINYFIERVEANALFVRGSSRAVPYDMLVWTAGVKPNVLARVLAAEGVSLYRGRVATNEFLQIPEYRSVFVVGDIGTQMNTDSLPPMTAQTAIDQGAYVARTLHRLFQKHRLFPFVLQRSRCIAPIGGKYALADLGTIKIEGLPAWLLKRFTALRYFLSILPFKYALTLWVRGVKLYVRND